MSGATDTAPLASCGDVSLGRTPSGMRQEANKLYRNRPVAQATQSTVEGILLKLADAIC